MYLHGVFTSRRRPQGVESVTATFSVDASNGPEAFILLIMRMTPSSLSPARSGTSSSASTGTLLGMNLHRQGIRYIYIDRYR